MEIRKSRSPCAILRKTIKVRATPNAECQYQIVKALAHPTRRCVLKLFEGAEIRQINLARMVLAKFGKRITTALLH